MNKRLCLAASIAAASILSLSAVAQEHGPPPGASDRNLSNGASDVKGRSNEMERVRRDAEKPGKRTDNSPEEKFPQIKEDFERIQIINSDVLQTGAPGGSTDYTRMSEAAAEIKKRAARLKSNLFPPESEKQSKDKSKEAPPPQQEDLKTLLAALDGAIIGFVNSPIFQNTKVVDPQDSTKARQELEKVIKLSMQVENEAAKMK